MDYRDLSLFVSPRLAALVLFGLTSADQTSLWAQPPGAPAHHGAHYHAPPTVSEYRGYGPRPGYDYGARRRSFGFGIWVAPWGGSGPGPVFAPGPGPIEMAPPVERFVAPGSVLPGDVPLEGATTGPLEQAALPADHPGLQLLQQVRATNLLVEEQFAAGPSGADLQLVMARMEGYALRAISSAQEPWGAGQSARSLWRMRRLVDYAGQLGFWAPAESVISLHGRHAYDPPTFSVPEGADGYSSAPLPAVQRYGTQPQSVAQLQQMLGQVALLAEVMDEALATGTYQPLPPGTRLDALPGPIVEPRPAVPASPTPSLGQPQAWPSELALPRTLSAPSLMPIPEGSTLPTAPIPEESLEPLPELSPPVLNSPL